MPTNHRGLEIGAHNHANLVTSARHASENFTVNTLGQGDGSSAEYAVFSDNTPYGTTGKYMAKTYLMPDEGEDLPNELSTGFYSNPRRAEMAGIARANRHARTGDWGDQGAIKQRIAARRKNREAAIDHLARYGGAQ